MESLSQFKWISKWETWISSNESTIQFWFFANLSDHRLSLQSDQGFHDELIFFLSLFITFRANAGMSIIPSPCSFLYAFHLQWSLNISTDKKSNAVCTFANLCSTLFSLWFKFSLVWFYFLSKCTKEKEKNWNVDTQFFKAVTDIFFMLLCLT